MSPDGERFVSDGSDFRFTGPAVQQPRPAVNEVEAAIRAAVGEDDVPGGQNIGDIADPDVVLTETTAERFSEAIEDMIDADPEMGAFLTYHPPNELRGHTLLMSDAGTTGVAISPEGDIQNLFNHNGPSGAGKDALVTAIQHGGCTLDCYDGYLRDLYANYGFRETGRMEFNPDYAPAGWNLDKFGHPDVVFMAYQPEALITAESDNYYTANEWDQAKQDARREADCRRGGRTEGREVGRGARGVNPRAGPLDGRDLDAIADAVEARLRDRL